MTPQEFFKGDIFAVNAGVELLEVREGYARAQLKITKEHLNAGGRTQGGALFTLADLALAACSNSYGKLSFSLSADITFLRASGEGDMLTATATMKYIGRTTGYFEVDITNQSDKLIASFRSSVFRMDEQVPFTV
jgi:acyl-CoA thioesterase